MWTLVKTEIVSDGTLLSFAKGEMERNTIVSGDVETQTAALITQWEAEDALVVTGE